MSAPAEPSGVDLARIALKAAKAAARLRNTAAQQKEQARTIVRRTKAGPDARDPMRLGPAITRLLAERGWDAPAAAGDVMDRWPDIVGPDLAAHCKPTTYDEAERVLTVRCDSAAWATNLRILAPTLTVKLNADAGDGVVRSIRVLGPHR